MPFEEGLGPRDSGTGPERVPCASQLSQLPAGPHGPEGSDAAPQAVPGVEKLLKPLEINYNFFWSKDLHFLIGFLEVHASRKMMSFL